MICCPRAKPVKEATRPRRSSLASGPSALPGAALTATTIRPNVNLAPYRPAFPRTDFMTAPNRCCAPERVRPDDYDRLTRRGKGRNEPRARVGRLDRSEKTRDGFLTGAPPKRDAFPPSLGLR